MEESTTYRCFLRPRHLRLLRIAARVPRGNFARCTAPTRASFSAAGSATGVGGGRGDRRRRRPRDVGAGARRRGIRRGMPRRRRVPRCGRGRLRRGHRMSGGSRGWAWVHLSGTSRGPDERGRLGGRPRRGTRARGHHRRCHRAVSLPAAAGRAPRPAGTSAVLPGARGGGRRALPPTPRTRTRRTGRRGGALKTAPRPRGGAARRRGPARRCFRRAGPDGRHPGTAQADGRRRGRE